MAKNIAQVNKAITAAGLDWELVKGEGYFYFMPRSDATGGEVPSIYTTRISEIDAADCIAAIRAATQPQLVDADDRLAIELALGIALPHLESDWPIGLTSTAKDAKAAGYLIGGTYGARSRSFLAYLATQAGVRAERVAPKPEPAPEISAGGVSLTLSWAMVVEIAIAALENGTAEGKRIARAELRNIARAADQMLAGRAA